MANNTLRQTLDRRRLLGAAAGLSVGAVGLTLLKSGAAQDYNYGDDDGTPDASPEASPMASPVANAGAEVRIKSLRFLPDELTVPVGTTVTWTNDELIGHTVTGAWAASEVLSLDDTFEFTFEEAGIYDYVCAIHDNMVASIIVE